MQNGPYLFRYFEYIFVKVFFVPIHLWQVEFDVRSEHRFFLRVIFNVVLTVHLSTM